jgi:hypothetical protein
MPGLTPHARHARYQWALDTLYFNPCKHPKMGTFMGACRIIESYEQYYKNHPHPDLNYKPVLPKLSQAFHDLAKQINWDSDEAERFIQDVLNSIKSIR